MRTESVDEVDEAWGDFICDFKESNLYHQILEKDVNLESVLLYLKVAFLSGVVAEVQRRSES